MLLLISNQSIDAAVDTLSYYYVISNHIVEYYIKYMFDTSQITNLLVLLLSSIRITDETAFTESEIEGFQDYSYSYFIGQMIQNHALIIDIIITSTIRFRLPPGTNRLLLGTNLVVQLNLVIKQQIKQ